MTKITTSVESLVKEIMHACQSEGEIKIEPVQPSPEAAVVSQIQQIPVAVGYAKRRFPRQEILSIAL